MKIFAFRHNKFKASWSQFNEPNIYKNGYMYAEILVLVITLRKLMKCF